MAETLKDNIRTELLFASKHPNLNEWQKRYAKNLAKYLEDKDETEIRKILYASLHQGGTRGGNIRGIVSALGKDSDVFKTYVDTAPSFKTDKEKIAESFKDVGGEKIFDERSKKWWPANRDIDKAKVEAVAKNLGMTTNELYKKMEEEANKESMKNISKGADIGGWGDSPKSFLRNLGGRTFGFFRPRAQELIAEAGKYSPEEFQAKMAEADVLDAAENIAYGFNPVQRGVGLGVRTFGKLVPSIERGIERIGKTSLGKTTIGGGTSAFVNPTLMEVADAIVYDEGPRANVSTSDILLGTGVNLSPRLISRRINQAMSLGSSMSSRGAGKTLAMATGEIGTKEKTKPTHYEFFSDLKKKQNEYRIARDSAYEKGEYGLGDEAAETILNPSELKMYRSYKPIFKDSDDMDDIAGTIVQTMSKKGYSLNEATQEVMKQIDPSKRISIVEATKKVKPVKVKDEFGNVVEELEETFEPFKIINGKVYPTKDFVAAIEKSSFAPALNPESMAKPLTKKEKLELKRQERDKGLTRAALSYGLGKMGDEPEYAEQVASSLLPPVGDFLQERKKKAEEEKRDAEEEEARKSYEFKDWSEVE